MPEYDDTFLEECGKYERRRWRSYSLNRTKNSTSTQKRRSFYALLKNDNYDNEHCDSGSSTPCSSTGSSGHKGSLRGTKLARRARSFKDDFLEKISQIRTPTNTMTRSHSPNSPRGRNSKGQVQQQQQQQQQQPDEVSKPVHDLNYHVRQVKHALTHFKDVVSKNKLEMLSGNGTVVLDMIANVHVALQSYTLNEHSSTLISATTHVYLSLGKLIKLCDEVLLSDDEENCASLNKENVKEVVDLVDNAVNNLVKLANEKLTERENASMGMKTSNQLQRPTIDVAGQRTSLPDIPLTPRERDILEKSSVKPVRASHSTESILRDTSPPPKPPLPNNRSTEPPPLPPKRRSHQRQNLSMHDSDCISDAAFLACGLDRMSLRSRSPEDNSSLLSASAGSLDSALNHSREEDELRALTVDQSIDDNILTNDVDQLLSSHNNSVQTWEEPDNCHQISSGGNEKINGNNNRHSNESGFVSMHSLRSSIQSVSTKRSSQQSFSQQQKFSTTNSSVIQKSESILESLSEQSSSISSSTSSSIQQQQKSISNFSSSKFSNVSQTKVTDCNNITKIKTDGIATIQSQVINQNDSGNISSIKLGQSQISSELIKSSDKEFTAISSQRSVNLGNFSAIIRTGSIDRNNSISNDDVFTLNNDGDTPPALPVKTRKHSCKRERHMSHYDNVEDAETAEQNTQDQHLPLAFISHPQHLFLNKHQSLPNKHQSLIEPRHLKRFDNEQPPPLPLKKKHIMAYMEIFGNCSHSAQSTSEFLRHSVHTYNVTHSTEHITHSQSVLSHSQTMSLSPQRQPLIQSPPGSPSPLIEKPPALPPKRHRVNSRTPSIITTPPSSPKLLNIDIPQMSNQLLQNNNNIPDLITTKLTTTLPIKVATSPKKLQNASVVDINNVENNKIVDDKLIDVDNYVHLCDTTTTTNSNTIPSSSTTTTSTAATIKNNDDNNKLDDNTNNKNDETEVVLRRHISGDKNGLVSKQTNQDKLGINLIEEIDISKYLVIKKKGEDGPDVKGGHPDALIIHATRRSDNEYGEAFITTFRTFILPLQLIEKLIHRYTLFHCQINDQKQRAAKESFSLLVRVVNDLTAPDLNHNIMELLMDFVYQLVCSGQLMMAKLLRVKVLEKVSVFKLPKPTSSAPSTRTLITNPPSLLELKSSDIAEQMTLLDSELFQKIEIPEVLIWAQEQCEERSPNLTRFTEHFNKMSYWARSQILKQEDAKDREKHVIKFIKIMKHLRKINNYNSYLALLSALDSAPIRRLEWHKTITEGLKEYCALIDSGCSFRAYRQALAETNPPCIPYIGLVLQDLTFVHIGNQDYVNDGVINFSKRWQQHNIVVNMKRFKKCSSYPFKKNERIIGLFDNFENYLDEDAMWQISENIKPRGGRKPTVQ